MSEQPHFDPSAQAGVVDPTLQDGNTQFTLAECSADVTAAIEASMSAGRGTMKLEAGMSLAEQCDANYARLNERDISMAQVVGTMRDAATAAKAMNANGTVLVPRLGDAHFRYEVIGHREFLSEEPHPVDGAPITINTNTFALGTPKVDQGLLSDKEGDLMILGGFSDIEAEMAGYGVFTAREGYDGATCRIDEILDRLAATHTGKGVLEQNGIVVGEHGARGRERPEAPIALLPTSEVSAPEPLAETLVNTQSGAKVRSRRALGRLSLGRRNK